MKSCQWCFLIGFLFIGNLVFSQQLQITKRERGFYFLKGYVLHEDTISPIAGVSVINRQNLLGTLSNIKGAFLIKMKKNDTIQFSALGYQSVMFYFIDTSAEMPSVIKIYMKERAYELNDVNVYGYRIRRKFKPQEVDLRRTDNMTLDLMETRGHSAGFVGRNDYLLPAGFSLGEIYEMFSKKGKEKKKVQQLEMVDNLKKYIALRYNKKYVTEITGLKGAELDNFMNFCRPPDKLVIDGTDYELAYHVNMCLLDFKARE